MPFARAGSRYSDVRFATAAVNDASALAVFDIPASAAAEADRAIAEGVYSPVVLTKAADRVYFARGYSHHSMVVEFPTFLAVVEAPYTEAQSHTLARELKARFPAKPIRYVAVTHFHYDHTGGVRGLASYGATVLVEKGHEAVMRPVMESPHTNPPDALQRVRQGGTAGLLEIFDGRRTISEGPQRLELYTITGNPHVDPKVLAFVPSTRGALPKRPLLPRHGRRRQPRGGASLRGDQGAQAEGRHQRRRPRRRGAVRGTGKGRARRGPHNRDSLGSARSPEPGARSLSLALDSYLLIS